MSLRKHETNGRKSSSGESNSVSSLRRFEKSMEIDYEKWHDGVGYDLDAIKAASQAERLVIEQILIHHSPRDWRDIEALAQIDTETARKAIKEAIKDLNPAVRAAIVRYAPNLITNGERSHSIIEALQHAKVFGGLSQILDDIEEYHPIEVKQALIEGLLSREGNVAVLFAAMLFYIYGKAKEPFDMSQRPFFLRFNTENIAQRMLAFQELCEHLGISPERYVKPK